MKLYPCGCIGTPAGSARRVRQRLAEKVDRLGPQYCDGIGDCYLAGSLSIYGPAYAVTVTPDQVNEWLAFTKGGPTPAWLPLHDDSVRR